jgi:dTDP-4-amino-4,6-dideoxygalactose transaminase
LGARPVFVDIDERTFNINAQLVAEKITKRTRAIMPVHMYGQCAEMDPLLKISEQSGLPIIEDAAQAIGAEDRGRRAGSMGRMGCLSFYPSKNLGGAGDGGMVVTNDEDLAARLQPLHVHGETQKYHHKWIGINSRLDALQATVLRVKLPYLDKWTSARQYRAARYQPMFNDAGLGEEIELPLVRSDARHVFHHFVIRVRGGRRDQLRAHLQANGIGADIYYPVPLHLQECFSYLDHRKGDYANAERASEETLALPTFPELTDEQQEYVVKTIADFYR